ncbi:MAG TPA: histidinol-phosphatase HisJ family protein [Candidatus Goldiibacteriota bacterium]|mgnify:CR=1 FL=1|nr:histidinol-phosphatase HisJ family protein [Candidatus Goldiibacteriota bacterium]
MYNLTDTHLHSVFSWDARQKPCELAKKAAQKGLAALCLTEHIDLMDGHQKNYTKFDYEGYTEECKKASDIFPGFLKGIEAGEVHEYADRFESFMEGKEFDYVLGSVHSMAASSPVFDEYFSKFDTLEDGYRRYFEELYRLISRGGFDVAAHLTLVHRQGGRHFKKPVYWTFKQEIDNILKLMVERKIGLEVNTSGLRFPSHDFVPDRETIAAYLRMGGDIITVGSDAHKLSDSFLGLEKAYEMLESLGVSEVTVFKARKPVKVKIRKEQSV